MARGSPDWQPWMAVQRFSETGGATPYEQKITVPSGTGAGPGETTQTMVLERGFISKVWIRFPQGPAGLLHIRLFNADDSEQIFPGGADTYFSGDNEIIEFDTEYDTEEEAGSYEVELHGYNEDDAYPHAALVRIWVIALPA